MELFEIILGIILISLSPLEMKAGIPLAILHHEIHPFLAYFLCCLANLLAVPLSYYLLKIVDCHLSGIQWYDRLFSKIRKKSEGKVKKYVDRFGFFGLLLFVAIPLPFTGAYIGSLAAWSLKINLKKAALSIGLGIMFAGILVTVVSLLAKGGVAHF